MWRPARVPLHQSRRSSLAQQEPAPAPAPTEKGSFVTRAAVGFGLGTITGVIIAAIDKKKLAGPEMVAGAAAGFVVASVLQLSWFQNI